MFVAPDRQVQPIVNLAQLRLQPFAFGDVAVIGDDSHRGGWVILEALTDRLNIAPRTIGVP